MIHEIVSVLFLLQIATIAVTAIEHCKDSGDWGIALLLTSLTLFYQLGTEVIPLSKVLPIVSYTNYFALLLFAARLNLKSLKSQFGRLLPFVQK